MKALTLPVVFILALTLSVQVLAGGVETVRNESKQVDVTDIADCMPAVARGDVLTFRGVQGKEACRLYIEANYGDSGSPSPSRPDISRAPTPPSSGTITTPEECYKRFEAGEQIHYAGRTGRDACDFYLQYSMNQAQLKLQYEQLLQQQRLYEEQRRLQQQQGNDVAEALRRQQILQLFGILQQQQHNQPQQNPRLSCTTQYYGDQAYTNCR